MARRKTKSCVAILCLVGLVAGASAAIPQVEPKNHSLRPTENDVLFGPRVDLGGCDKQAGELGVYLGPRHCADDPEEAC